MIATVGDLTSFAEEMGLMLPEPYNDRERLLRIAEDQVQALGTRMRFSDDDLAALDATHLDALNRAVCSQAAWVYEEDEYLGSSDIAGLGEGITFMPRETRTRLSPSVLEILSLTGLIARTGTALPDPVPVIPERPWWLWL